MTKIAVPLTLLAAVLVCSLPAAPAQAGANRTFVSGAGSDTGSCGFAAPCRTFAYAYSQTNANGEINVLDPAGYGRVIIGQAISIQGHGWASVTATMGDAITISAGAGDNINIRGVLLDGAGVGDTGITFNSGASLNIQDSAIRNFSGAGIQFQPSGSSQLYVSNTVVSDNAGNGGIDFANGGSGTVGGVLDHVVTENNGFGVLANVSTTVMERNSTIANNNYGLFANGSGAVIRVTRSTITANGTGWSISGGGSVLSYCDNNIDNNTSVNTAPGGPCPVLPYK